VWLEITNLLIPGANDTDAEIDAMTSRVVERLGPDVPMHFTAFPRTGRCGTAHRPLRPR
jgi:pyruvate formate lyase activating enzyme